MHNRPSVDSSPSLRGRVSPSEALIAAAVLAVVAGAAPAQLQFDELPRRALPARLDFTYAVALGDVDGDGDVDLIVGNSGQNRLYLNDGTGLYTDVTAARMPIDYETTNAIALGDVDGDGDLDAVMGNGHFYSYGGELNRLYLNDGTGTYTDATATNMPATKRWTNALVLGDVDVDGDLDLVMGNTSRYGSAQNRLYLNDGTGVYSDVTAARMPALADFPTSVAMGDVDADGDLDVVFGNVVVGTVGQNRLYLNDGIGTFTDATLQRLPPDSDQTHAVALGDVDADGDLDIVFGNSGGMANDRLYLNDGFGTYTDSTATHMPACCGVSTNSVALGDTDGDGDLDLCLGDWGQERLYLNDGSGVYADVSTARVPPASAAGYTQAVALGDVDGDGDLDWVLGKTRYSYGAQNRLYLNLQRQLYAPLQLSIGNDYTLEAYARYGPPSLSTTALPFLATASASIPIPPYGTFRLDPTQMVALPPFAIAQPLGLGSMTLAVPNVTGLAGRLLYAQALLVPPPFQERLTNLTRDEISR